MISNTKKNRFLLSMAGFAFAAVLTPFGFWSLVGIVGPLTALAMLICGERRK